MIVALPSQNIVDDPETQDRRAVISSIVLQLWATIGSQKHIDVPDVASSHRVIGTGTLLPSQKTAGKNVDVPDEAPSNRVAASRYAILLGSVLVLTSVLCVLLVGLGVSMCHGQTYHDGLGNASFATAGSCVPDPEFLVESKGKSTPPSSYSTSRDKGQIYYTPAHTNGKGKSKRHYKPSRSEGKGKGKRHYTPSRSYKNKGKRHYHKSKGKNTTGKGKAPNYYHQRCLAHKKHQCQRDSYCVWSGQPSDHKQAPTAKPESGWHRSCCSQVTLFGIPAMFVLVSLIVTTAGCLLCRVKRPALMVLPTHDSPVEDMLCRKKRRPALMLLPAHDTSVEDMLCRVKRRPTLMLLPAHDASVEEQVQVGPTIEVQVQVDDTVEGPGQVDDTVEVQVQVDDTVEGPGQVGTTVEESKNGDHCLGDLVQKVRSQTSTHGDL